MVFQAEDRTRAKKQHADAAIQMALQGRWAEALQINQMIVESFPTDVEAYNLGKDAWIKRVERLAIAWFRGEARYTRPEGTT